MEKKVDGDDEEEKTRGINDNGGGDGSEDNDSGFSKEDEGKLRLIPSSEVDENGVVREYEVALKHLGFGFFHVLLLFISGVVLSSECVVIYSVSFILPVLEWESAKEALIASTMFGGVLFGSFMWGSLADIIGRKTIIILALLINAIFGFFSAFIPWFWIFILFRFLSGFGGAGIFHLTYMSEFIRNKYRGPFLMSQIFFWMVGQLVSIALAWAIIPIGQLDLFGYELESWRLYLAICALPLFVSAALYFLLPESPRFLLQVGKHEKALKILRLVHRLNHLRNYAEYPVKFIFLDGIENDSTTSKMRTAGEFCKEMFVRNINLFRLKFLRQTVLLLIVILCLSLGNFGTIMWYPTYVSQLTTRKDVHDHQMFCNTTTSFSPTDKMALYCGCSSSVFQDTTFSLPELKKWRINDVLFRNVTFLNVNFDSVLFNGTEFRECKFQNSTFTRVFFNATNFNDVQFQSVNILPTSLCLFSNQSKGAVTLENVTLNGRIVEPQNVNISKLSIILESGVNSTCDDNQYAYVKCKADDFHVYRDSFIVAGSILPGNIASAIAVYFFHRNHWLAFSMFVSAVSVFLLYIVSSETYVVAMLCIFNAVSTPSWSNLSLVFAELYPTHIRSTAIGLRRIVAMTGAIIGTNVFGLFVKVNPSIPILLIASLFLVGAVCSLGVPSTSRKTLLN